MKRFALTLAVAQLFCGCALTRGASRAPPAPASNRAIVLAVIERAWNAGDVGGLDTLLAPLHRFHFRGRVDTISIAGFQRTVMRWRAGLADFRMRVEDVVADGDRVAVRATMTGTHEGSLLGVPPSGRRVSASMMVFARIENRRIVEIWEDYDEYGLRRQLTGADPGRPEPLANEALSRGTRTVEVPSGGSAPRLIGLAATI